MMKMETLLGIKKVKNQVVHKIVLVKVKAKMKNKKKKMSFGMKMQIFHMKKQLIMMDLERDWLLIKWIGKLYLL